MTARLLTLMVVLSFVVSTPVAATIIEVDWSGGGDHLTIQDGVTAAGEGDTVLVRPGTYTGTGNINIDFAGTNCVLLGNGGAMNVTIDCEGSGRAFYFHSHETLDCAVEGFTVTNGSQAYGGAMYFINSTPTIRDCVISENTVSVWGGAVICTSASGPTFTGCAFLNNGAVLGGAAYFESDSSPSFTNCTFASNTAADGGGGVYVASGTPAFTGCTFEDNSLTTIYKDGGGMYMTGSSSPTLVGCLFTDNSATDYGGGAFISDASSPSLVACTFTGNEANTGGGVAIDGNISPSFDSCWFSDNTATMYTGGGLYAYDGATPTITACTLTGNTAAMWGGAMCFESFTTPVVTSCTLYANSASVGSGIWCDDNFTLTNCIIAFGVVGEAIYCDGDSPYPSCSDIYGNAGGDWIGCLAGLDLVDNNVHEDPLFCDAPSGDFSIDVASPCTAVNAPACGLVGSWDIGCDTPVQMESWGAIKAMYR